MRRIIQSSGAEVIHLGHDRSVEEVVNCAIQEDAQAIAMTSYQGGHVEYFKYMYDLLKEKEQDTSKYLAVVAELFCLLKLKSYRNTVSPAFIIPDDGRSMGLQGMINDLLQRVIYLRGKLNGEVGHLLEKTGQLLQDLYQRLKIILMLPKLKMKRVHELAAQSTTPVLGITGTGGAGKSSLVDELVRRFLIDFPEKYIGVVSVDPSKRKTGGALLGDRIRMNAIRNPRVYMRSLATRQSNLALSKHVSEAVAVLKAAKYDLIILETSGIGQSDTEIIEHSDVSLYVMTPEYGAASQLEKIDMLDFADLIALNKFDKRGALDALRDVKKQYKKSSDMGQRRWQHAGIRYDRVAVQWSGMNNLYKAVMDRVVEKNRSTT